MPDPILESYLQEIEKKRDEILDRIRNKTDSSETMIIYREGKVAGLNLALYILRYCEEAA